MPCAFAHVILHVVVFCGGALKKKIPWSEMLRLGKLQKGHMDLEVHFWPPSHHPPIFDPDASHETAAE